MKVALWLISLILAVVGACYTIPAYLNSREKKYFNSTIFFIVVVIIECLAIILK